MKQTTRDCIDHELVAHAQAALQCLKHAGLTVVTAKSCTAGLSAAALSQADGAGEVLHGSFVTYAKDAFVMPIRCVDR